MTDRVESLSNAEVRDVQAFASRLMSTTDQEQRRVEFAGFLGDHPTFPRSTLQMVHTVVGVLAMLDWLLERQMPDTAAEFRRVASSVAFNFSIESRFKELARQFDTPVKNRRHWWRRR